MTSLAKNSLRACGLALFPAGLLFASTAAANADPFDASPSTLYPDSIINNHTGYPS